jgi:hypothetical protein
LLALAVIPFQAFVLAKVLVCLTEDFTHIDGLLSGLGRDLQPR